MCYSMVRRNQRLAVSAKKSTLARLALLLRYLWALPNTFVGLLFVPLTCVKGGQRRIVDGVLELDAPAIAWMLRRCIPMPGGAAAMTLGHVVIGRDGRALALTRDHERAHVRQCEAWGPVFIPAYLLAGVWAMINGRAAYRDNYFERQAEGDTGVPARAERRTKN
jgi:hypothetical protein